MIRLFFVLITFLSPPAIGALHLEYDESQMLYSVYGDMSNIAVIDMYKLGPTTQEFEVRWPSRNGVWIFPIYYKFMGALDPIELGPSLRPDQDPKASLSRLVAPLLSSGIPLPYLDPKREGFVALAVCDYKTVQVLWKCLLAPSGTITPPKPQEPPLSCSILGSIDLRHGNITLDNVANNRATTTAFVSCNRSANVSIAIAPDKAGRVKLNGVEGLYSLLSVEGVGSGRSFSFYAGTGYRSLVFASVLQTQGNVTAGSFSGSASVVLTFP
ncbi:hypothetical protein GGD92_04260 [Pseudomonas protegens]|uniref:Fimbrial adhesin MrpH C-terminal domain-containing protein n=1 Tax=Pseudomonas protegens TaxID=380021 RepID=A0A7G7XC02_9PSED|nr:PapG chaperone-binding domain-containing protein [Pseudomonas protegens]QNH77497.1 hypothetical protein GGI48_30395 [Pseudomonas protegens]QNL06693.1 hypothetical protein GGD92_04260 [Pseudomonas protegens]